MTDPVTKKAPAAPAEKPKPSFVAMLAAVTLLSVALDLGTKEWALTTLSSARDGEAPPPLCVTDENGYAPYQRRRGAPIILVDGILEFRYAENCGAAFGLGRDASPFARLGIFGVAAVAAILALSWMVVQGRGGRWFMAAAPLVVAGAIGNLADRLRHGFVVDFVRFHLEDGLPAIGIQPGWEYPTFNVADAYIVVGVAFLVIDGFIDPKKKPKKKKAEEPAKVDESAAAEKA